MIKKILLYIVFAIPSLVFGFFAYFYNGADARSSITGALAFLLVAYLILAWATGDLNSKKPQATYNIESLSVDLSESELKVLNDEWTNKLPKNADARADNIFRQLRQWQALNDEPVNWNNDSPKYSISYNYECGLGISISTINRMAGVVYFSSRSKVKEAYAVFKPDLLWYFTEYRQRLDEPVVV